MNYTHTKSGRNFLFVEVPNTASRLTTYSGSEPTLYYFINSKIHEIELQANYKIISEDITTMNESEASEVVATLWNGYTNYKLKDQPVGNYARYVKNTALESLKSLTESLGINAFNLMSEEPNIDDYLSSRQYAHFNRIYQEAQAKVKRYCLLEVIN